MSTDSSTDHYNTKPLRIITESEVVEAFASSGVRGEIVVLDRFTPHMLQGALTKGALFQIAFHIEDSDVNADRGLLYSAILLHAATLVLAGDAKAWRQLRTRPGKLGEFLTVLSVDDGSVFSDYSRMLRDTKPLRVAAELAPAPIDLLDLVLTRLHLNYEALAFLRDHLQDVSMKRLVRGLLLMRENEPVPGNA